MTPETVRRVANEGVGRRRGRVVLINTPREADTRIPLESANFTQVSTYLALQYEGLESEAKRLKS